MFGNVLSVHRHRFALGTVACLHPGCAWAGMTSYHLTDIVSTRLEVISFFLFVTLLLAFLFHLCWNSLAQDFAWMPALNFRKSFTVIIVASLFCGLILTMISGARELMTPGAWERVGTGYKLRDPKREPELWLDAARRRALEQLRDALWNHAQNHGGRLPSESFATDIPSSLWRAPDPDNTPYIYLPRPDAQAGTFGWERVPGGRDKLKGDPRDYILAYEPLPFGSERFALLATGSVTKLKTQSLADRVKAESAQLGTATPEGAK